MGSEPRFGLMTARGLRPRVIVVDRNTSTAMVTTMLVEQFGCTPVLAPNGEAALAMLRRGESADLVILDMGLADQEGIVLAQLIRTLGARGAMPILAIAAGRPAAARAAGLSGLIRKPYSPRELYGAMQSVLSKPAVVVPHQG